MYKALITFSSSKYSDAELLVKSSDIVSDMTGNLNFVEPSPSLAEVEAAQSAYGSALNACSTGARQAYATKDVKRKALETILRNLGNYVNSVANGDEAMLLTSGFDLSKPAEAVGPLPAPQNVQVKPGRSRGTVIVSCDRVAHAKNYAVGYQNLTEGEDSPVEMVFAAKPKITIANLVSGNKYRFRFLALGTDPERNWSEDATSFIL